MISEYIMTPWWGIDIMLLATNGTKSENYKIYMVDFA